MSTLAEAPPRGIVRKLWHVNLLGYYWRWRCTRCHQPGAWSGNYTTQPGALRGALRHMVNKHGSIRRA